MLTLLGSRLVPTPFAEIIDATTGRVQVRVRYVDVTSDTYQILCAYDPAQGGRPG